LNLSRPQDVGPAKEMGVNVILRAPHGFGLADSPLEETEKPHPAPADRNRGSPEAA
jgi:hypothetical protein